MARANSIWVVLNGDMLIIAFTVKHELISWLSGQKDAERYMVFKIPDGEEFASKGMAWSVRSFMEEVL